TREGAQIIATADTPLPATWLCVFDPSIRYLNPGRTGNFGELGTYFDPFDSYCLDTDSIPEKIKPNDYHAKREIPKDAWDAFLPNRLDRDSAKDGNLALLRGYRASNLPRLSSRL